ncbi:GntR family transcriptional regulator [Vallicoccus soli]|uniref:GntR family transcriptional regulator n=1 Tax=Vallicoccus soli TaxID=2339232 RepID=A0A3A3ZK65_9ACTN|nr:GntR family transcriptional regulator [Vallicoccus soli]RJK96254.1 GntR family transcriptional regulator [Vallicoccus soli]
MPGGPDGAPLFRQVAELVEAAVLDGSLPEGARAPSTNELAAFHRINPATAAKGLQQLVDDGVLHQRRGLGAFVSDGARERLLERRRRSFARQYVGPLVEEARALGLDPQEVRSMLESALAQGAADGAGARS